MDKYPLKKYPVVGACCLNCGLCPRYYDEGRSKSFYCTSCQLIPLDRLRKAVSGAETGIAEGAGIKEKAKVIRTAINNLADTLKIDLELRK